MLRDVLIGLCAASVLAGCMNGQGSTANDPPIPPYKRTAGQTPAKAAPEKYRVKFETSKGDVIIEVTRKWSPYGADRFYELVNDKFYDNCRFFRVVTMFMAQFGINGDPAVNAKWKDKNIPDDHLPLNSPDRQSNKRGTITFAKKGEPNSRTTQVFINFVDNGFLDAMGFTPFGRVVQGMNVVDSFYDGYREEPQQSADRIEAEGNAYLNAAFPQLDWIKKAMVLPAETKPAEKKPAGGAPAAK